MSLLYILLKVYFCAVEDYLRLSVFELKNKCRITTSVLSHAEGLKNLLKNIYTKITKKVIKKKKDLRNFKVTKFFYKKLH